MVSTLCRATANVQRLIAESYESSAYFRRFLVVVLDQHPRWFVTLMVISPQRRLKTTRKRVRNKLVTRSRV